IPLIATNCIRNDALFPTYEKVRYVSQKTYETWFRGHPAPGDIIFVNKGTPGLVCMVPDPVDFCIAQDMVSLRPDPSKVYPRYLFAALRSPKVQYSISSMHVGTLIPHFKKGDFDKLLVPLPDVETQKVIGDVYYNLSLKIELNRKMNQTLEAIARAIFKSWFVDFDPVIDNALAAGKPTPKEFAERAARHAQLAHGKSSLPENIRRLFPDEFQDSELGPIPEGWEVGTVVDLGNIVCGKTPPTSEPANYGNEIPFITIPDMRDRVFVTTTARYLSPIGAATQPKKLLPPLSVCVSCIATPGLVALTSQPSHTNQQINSIICRDDISPYWCYSQLVNMKNEIVTGGAGGSATLNLNKGEFSSLKLVLPDKHVIAAFHAETAPLFESILAMSNQMAVLSAIRDLLLPRLLSKKLILAMDRLGGK
ncbi:MAG: restriction endonuclease subunit S, partial [Deltaproteobacteria bacterium]|nr:restriction endonuclease subunit S [Deltaproteobacteria bacterium]